jgi:small subunit ribosomal protein S1
VPIAKQRRLSVGDEVEGVVGHVGPDSVFVDLDDRQQAFYEAIDLRDAEGKPTVEVGDRIKGWVLDTTGGQIKLGRRFGRDGGAGSGSERFQTAFEARVPVEGKVTGINKGGAEIDLGGVRAFCPVSQLDDRYVADAASFVGRTLSFLITKLESGGKQGGDVVLSRRALLEREKSEARGRVLTTLSVGSIVKGQVTQIREFGAFVDLGGVDGLVPARELSHDRVRPDEVVQIGDLLEVQVKAIEKKGDKTEITLSLKALAADPWSAIDAVAPVGRVVAGQVTRLAEFGAFVRIGSGIEGLLHVSELGSRVQHPKDAVEIGQAMLVRVISVDTARKRIALAPASDGAGVGAEDRGARVIVGSIVQAIVEKVESYGVVTQIAGSKGRSGRAVIPNAETGTRQGADLRREFPIGKAITAKVIEASDNRVRLSIRAAAEDAERADFDNFRAGQGSSGMGTLGDLLKKKTSSKKK